MHRDRRKPRSNHERWLVSYADFMTLLFAFFVVLYSSARVDQKKMAQLAQAIQNGFQQMGVGSGTVSVAPPNYVVKPPAATPQSDLETAEEIRSRLEKELTEELRRHDVDLRDTPEGLVLSLREVGFFDSGSAVMRATSTKTLDRIGQVLSSVSCNIRVEGHTDTVPIHNSQFQSNWELSTARATEITRILMTREGIGAQRLSAAGYAEYHPVADNSTEDGRRKNRRVDLVILAAHRATSIAQPAPVKPEADSAD